MDTYEKKYNEAMFRADEAVQKGCLDKDMFDNIFPPEESEDERMIRKIESFLSAYGADYFSNDEWREIENWLEKKKERDLDIVPELRPTAWGEGYRHGVMDTEKKYAGIVVPQGEQKSVDIELINGVRDELLGIEDNAKNIDGLNDGQWVAIRMAHRLLGEYINKEQKPEIELKQVTEEQLHNLNEAIKGLRMDGCERMADSLHSLYNILKTQEQKPAWSEEDEERVKEAIKRIDELEFLGIPCNNVRKVLESLRPCHSWKPSEEHLSALLAIFNDPDNIGSATCQLALTDLYEQLLKLK